MAKKNKTIYIVSPTFNEENNVALFYDSINKSIQKLRSKYNFKILIIDNSSTDNTLHLLKEIAKKDKNFLVIANNRNFGHIRSPYWGVLQSAGDATIYLNFDLQDPPALIPKFIKAWEEGSKVVWGVKRVNSFDINSILRESYYKFLNKISNVNLINNANGFGLYDKCVIDHIRKINDPYPYFRGLVMELGYEVCLIDYDQVRRLSGKSKNNIFTLYDIALLGIIRHSTVPLRLASILGFLIGFTSLLVAFIFLVLKFLNWDYYPLGYAPIIIGLFLMFGIVLIFIGFLGEYINSILLHVQNRPIVVEKERINF